MKQKTKPTRNGINNAVKKIKDDLARHKSMTANAVRELVDHGQTCEGATMQVAQELGQTMGVLDALIEHLGCEAPVRAILEKTRAERDAQRAARDEAVSAPVPEVPPELLQ
jgi:hypothetical protein